MWKTVKLDEIVNLSIGKTPSRGNVKLWDKEKRTKNIWLSIADLSALAGLYVEDSKEYISDEGAKLFKAVPSETLIMSFKLSIGKLAITKCALRTNEAIVALSIKDEKLISKEYLYYFLFSIDWDALAGNDVKVKGKTLNKAKLKEIPICLPPLAEQQRIVAKLDAAFAEIDGAVEAASAKETEVEKLKASLLSASLSGDADNWKSLKIVDVCKLNYGKGLDKKDRLEDGPIPAFGANGIKTFSCKPLHIKPSIIIGRKGSAGELCKVTIPFWALDVTYFVTFDEANVDLDFLFYTFQSLNLPSMARGVKPGLNRNDVYNLLINLPSLTEQQRIVAKLNTAYSEFIIANEALTKSNINYLALKSAILAQELQSEAA